MSRSSVVWGLQHRVGPGPGRRHPVPLQIPGPLGSFFFVAGTLLGGLYEYLCSVFTELVFGTVFWDYSAIPFNLAAHQPAILLLLGLRRGGLVPGALPHPGPLDRKIPPRPGKAVVWLLIAFMSVNMAVSGLALARYSAGPPESPPTRPGNSTWTPTTVTT